MDCALFRLMGSRPVHLAPMADMFVSLSIILVAWHVHRGILRLYMDLICVVMNHELDRIPPSCFDAVFARNRQGGLHCMWSRAIREHGQCRRDHFRFGSGLNGSGTWVCPLDGVGPTHQGRSTPEECKTNYAKPVHDAFDICHYDGSPWAFTSNSLSSYANDVDGKPPRMAQHRVSSAGTQWRAPYKRVTSIAAGHRDKRVKQGPHSTRTRGHCIHGV